MDNCNEEPDIYPINSLEGLVKICGCKYNVHKMCILDWIKNKPVCVMCDKPIFYVDNNIPNEIVDDIENNVEIIYQETSSSFCYCLLTSITVTILVGSLYLWS
tara:strand:- start:18 stop:326 length:309 start_codon:yes stop_codon:yes gene_type:complete